MERQQINRKILPIELLVEIIKSIKTSQTELPSLGILTPGRVNGILHVFVSNFDKFQPELERTSGFIPQVVRWFKTLTDFFILHQNIKEFFVYAPNILICSSIIYKISEKAFKLRKVILSK
ncbi:unnamed protein product [Meloidogyne enterolobii]|uniref:Uncharacterized protein n=3 Tax=Meloidogyne enterolobii TaxID=390850 RepID=A0A6V7THL1_MELEN|nr:unnamed protein product [Meloidogyne enterolobii]